MEVDIDIVGIDIARNDMGVDIAGVDIVSLYCGSLLRELTLWVTEDIDVQRVE